MTSVQRREARTMPLHALTASTSTPIATVAANLMPPELLAKRRLGWLKRRLAFVLTALVALVGLGLMLTAQSTSSARDDLATAQGQTAALQGRVNQFADTVRVQGDIAAIRSKLSTVMTGDLQWSPFLASLLRAAPPKVSVTNVAGELATDTSSADSDAGAFPSGQAATVGTLELSGTAKDYRAIASFDDALARVKGIGMVQPGSLGSQGGGASFTVTLSITKAAFGGRFTTSGGN